MWYSADRYNSSFALLDNQNGEYIDFGERVIIYYGEDIVLDDNVESLVMINYNDILAFSLGDIDELRHYYGDGRVIIYKDEIPYEWNGTIDTRDK